MSSRRSAPLTNQKNVDPQRIFMKLSVLEMEKKIAYQTRQDALKRVEKIDNKLKEINSAIADLLNRLDLCSAAESSMSSSQSQSPAAALSKGNNFNAKSQADDGRHFIVRY